MTVCCASLKRSASLPMVVVLPTPLTPTISITIGHLSGGRGMFIFSLRMSLRISRARSALRVFSAATRRLSSAIASSAVFMPMSAMIRMSVNSS